MREKITPMNVAQVAIVALLTLSIVLPEMVFADSGSGGFDTKHIVEETNKVRSFLFGPGAKAVGIFGGAWGIFQSIVSSSIKPLLVYGGIGLAANFLPKFIDMVFVG